MRYVQCAHCITLQIYTALRPCKIRPLIEVIWLRMQTTESTTILSFCINNSKFNVSA